MVLLWTRGKSSLDWIKYLSSNNFKCYDKRDKNHDVQYGILSASVFKFPSFLIRKYFDIQYCKQTYQRGVSIWFKVYCLSLDIWIIRGDKIFMQCLHLIDVHVTPLSPIHITHWLLYSHLFLSFPCYGNTYCAEDSSMVTKTKTV